MRQDHGFSPRRDGSQHHGGDRRQHEQEGRQRQGEERIQNEGVWVQCPERHNEEGEQQVRGKEHREEDRRQREHEDEVRRDHGFSPRGDGGQHHGGGPRQHEQDV